tara:strand:- start:4455 stop:4832 length:378 start_codon:yes stop_codon:yes gene_type:complete
MSKKEEYIVDPELLKRDSILRKLAKLFIWMLDFYSKINTWIFTVLPKGIARLLGINENSRFFTVLLANEFIANFFSILVLYVLAHSIFTPPIMSVIFYYWAMFNVLVMCGKALTWDSKSKKILKK